MTPDEAAKTLDWYLRNELGGRELDTCLEALHTLMTGYQGEKHKADTMQGALETIISEVLAVCQGRSCDASVWKDWRDSKYEAVKSALQRLAAYEDTGLTPDEITALKADRDAWRDRALDRPQGYNF